MVSVALSLQSSRLWADEGEETDQKLDKLIYILKNGELGVERAGAVIELGRYTDSSKAFEALLGALFDRDLIVIRYAIEALGKHANPAAYPYFKHILFTEAPPAKIDLYTSRQSTILYTLMENFGKIGNPSAIADIFDFFARIPDVVKDTVFITATAGLPRVRRDALLATGMLLRKFPRSELINLYYQTKPLLLATTTILPPDFAPNNEPIIIDKFAQEMAFFFLMSLRDDPVFSAGIFKVMVNKWSPDLRLHYYQNFIVYEEASEIILKGKLKRPGIIYGPFKLVDADGDTITQINASKHHISELKKHVGKEVVMRGKIQHREDHSFFGGDNHTYFIKFMELKSSS